MELDTTERTRTIPRKKAENNARSFSTPDARDGNWIELTNISIKARVLDTRKETREIDWDGIIAEVWWGRKKEEISREWRKPSKLIVRWFQRVLIKNGGRVGQESEILKWINKERVDWKRSVI